MDSTFVAGTVHPLNEGSGKLSVFYFPAMDNCGNDVDDVATTALPDIASNVNMQQPGSGSYYLYIHCLGVSSYTDA